MRARIFGSLGCAGIFCSRSHPDERLLLGSSPCNALALRRITQGDLA